jgi:hypothetical protein
MGRGQCVRWRMCPSGYLYEVNMIQKRHRMIKRCYNRVIKR